MGDLVGAGLAIIGGCVSLVIFVKALWAFRAGQVRRALFLFVAICVVLVPLVAASQIVSQQWTGLGMGVVWCLGAALGYGFARFSNAWRAG